MNSWKIVGKTERVARIVLVLQANEACWFRLGSDGSLESYTETLETSALNAESRCPWIRVPAGSPMPGIALLLDSPLDEVDRVRVEEVSTGWLRRLHCWRVRRRLHRQYPSASIHPLPAYSYPDVLSIVHHLLPEHWEQWLEQLQQTQVSISHVVTGLELFCRYAVTGSVSEGGPVLFNVPMGLDARHLLVDSGVPVFMRLAASQGVGSSSESVEALCQTLEHLRRHQPGSAAVPQLVEWVCTDEDDVGEDVVPGLLASLFFEYQRGTRKKSIDEIQCKSVLKMRSNAMQDKHATVGPLSATGRIPGQFAARRGLTESRWRLTARHRLANGLLKSSVARNRLQQRIRQLQQASILCVWLAALMVVVASAQGVASARDRARIGMEQQAVLGEVQELTVAVTSLSAHPAYLARSIERIDSHARVSTVDTGQLLMIVADAISEFPRMVLDDLSWATLPEEVANDTVFTAVEQVLDRRQLWQEDSPATRVHVELGGKVSSDTGLRGQQQTLEQFTRYLENLPSVSGIRVLESPVNVAARSGEQRVEGESAYRLSFLLERP